MFASQLFSKIETLMGIRTYFYVFGIFCFFVCILYFFLPNFIFKLLKTNEDYCYWSSAGYIGGTFAFEAC